MGIRMINYKLTKAEEGVIDYIRDMVSTTRIEALQEIDDLPEALHKVGNLVLDRKSNKDIYKLYKKYDADLNINITYPTLDELEWNLAILNYLNQLIDHITMPCSNNYVSILRDRIEASIHIFKKQVNINKRLFKKPKLDDIYGTHHIRVDV